MLDPRTSNRTFVANHRQSEIKAPTLETIQYVLDAIAEDILRRSQTAGRPSSPFERTTGRKRRTTNALLSGDKWLALIREDDGGL